MSVLISYRNSRQKFHKSATPAEKPAVPLQDPASFMTGLVDAPTLFFGITEKFRYLARIRTVPLSRIKPTRWETRRRIQIWIQL